MERGIFSRNGGEPDFYFIAISDSDVLHGESSELEAFARAHENAHRLSSDVKPDFTDEFVCYAGEQRFYASQQHPVLALKQVTDSIGFTEGPTTVDADRASFLSRLSPVSVMRELHHLATLEQARQIAGYACEAFETYQEADLYEFAYRAALGSPSAYSHLMYGIVSCMGEKPMPPKSEESRKAVRLMANGLFISCVLENVGNGNWPFSALPLEAFHWKHHAAYATSSVRMGNFGTYHIGMFRTWVPF